ncbi:phospho-N-acetylmuramoyl-pentapeptide-transferase [Keratinibaculum paraultunense]|uniref:Phospho-N-acetylmuramoyl-pentapeptide-transferase n=1 Tax=Keratinibaculum paraultunense TaxID=1278232 RepID=A0A4R3KYK0_9FIRM|nr:phospho-N-acetylmuramoyl-pentapeptide-transferase [Keratinibaculum paraultunense]QQY80535.1 phospho-N-acetylmuramoyl-pentapeptide-transferase [Keratinibaculum paraultunense]TCS91258.1 phospho-N-acetylmuramoyl-pentapeptide-transferase [Keratinibaculum paraultunense]
MVEYLDIIRTILISFIITIILGPIIIPLLKRHKIGQNVRDDGPKTHLAKSGTPTMGGIIMLIALLITTVTSGMLNRDMYILLISTFGFGLIGFIDDYLKVVNQSSLGLKPYQKLIGQIILAIILAIYQSQISMLGTKVIVPFLNNRYLDLGVLYVPFIAFVVVGTVNSVNLTDGLDGLASGVTLIVLSFFGLIALNWGMGSISIFSAALTGACLGFLIYNAYPAKVFMGDTGSMALGGAVAAIAILLNLPLMIPIVGGIYFVEALSVIIQVISYKLTGKRIFLMSPLHHHFEQKGWDETRIVVVFWSITVILCLIGVISLN